MLNQLRNDLRRYKAKRENAYYAKDYSTVQKLDALIANTQRDIWTAELQHQV